MSNPINENALVISNLFKNRFLLNGEHTVVIDATGKSLLSSFIPVLEAAFTTGVVFYNKIEAVNTILGDFVTIHIIPLNGTDTICFVALDDFCNMIADILLSTESAKYYTWRHSVVEITQIPWFIYNCLLSLSFTLRSWMFPNMQFSYNNGPLNCYAPVFWPTGDSKTPLSLAVSFFSQLLPLGRMFYTIAFVMKNRCPPMDIQDFNPIDGFDPKFFLYLHIIHLLAFYEQEDLEFATKRLAIDNHTLTTLNSHSKATYNSNFVYSWNESCKIQQSPNYIPLILAINDLATVIGEYIYIVKNRTPRHSRALERNYSVVGHAVPILFSEKTTDEEFSNFFRSLGIAVRQVGFDATKSFSDFRGNYEIVKYSLSNAANPVLLESDAVMLDDCVIVAKKRDLEFKGGNIVSLLENPMYPDEGHPLLFFPTLVQMFFSDDFDEFSCLVNCMRKMLNLEEQFVEYTPEDLISTQNSAPAFFYEVMKTFDIANFEDKQLVARVMIKIFIAMTSKKPIYMRNSDLSDKYATFNKMTPAVLYVLFTSTELTMGDVSLVKALDAMCFVENQTHEDTLNVVDLGILSGSILQCSITEVKQNRVCRPNEPTIDKDSIKQMIAWFGFIEAVCKNMDIETVSNFGLKSYFPMVDDNNNKFWTSNFPIVRLFNHADAAGFGCGLKNIIVRKSQSLPAVYLDSTGFHLHCYYGMNMHTLSFARRLSGLNVQTHLQSIFKEKVSPFAMFGFTKTTQ